MTIKNKRPVLFHFRSKTRSERGGITVVFNPATNNFGVAICNRTDAFCRKEGFRRAFGRTMSAKALPCHLYPDNQTIENLRSCAKNIAISVQARHNSYLESKIEKMVAQIRYRNILDVDEV